MRPCRPAPRPGVRWMHGRRRRPGDRRGAHGAALLTAMIIVSLVATLTATMVWQQWRAIQVEAAERSRSQASWMLSGALDWARIILREDAINQGPDHLGEPWAVPLAEARLSTFLAADRDTSDGGPEAFLSGAIEDAQARYNLRNLVEQGQVVAGELAVLRRLCESAGVSGDVAGRLAVGLRDAWASEGSPAPGTAVVAANPNPTVPPRTLAQLAWLGVEAATVERLAPHVVILPKRTTVNVNTASREVIAAVVDGLDLAGAERLVQTRAQTPFRQLTDVQRTLGGNITLSGTRVGTASSFFVVSGRMRLDDRLLEERSLVERQGSQIVPLSRERFASREEAAGAGAAAGARP